MTVLSPINYSGSRCQKVDDILALVKNKATGSKIDCFYELCAGSSVLSLNAMREDIAQSYVVNDAYWAFALFWEVVRDSPEMLIDQYQQLIAIYISNEGETRQFFYQEIQNAFNQNSELSESNKIEQATRFAFIINHANYSEPYFSKGSSNEQQYLQCQISAELGELEIDRQFSKCVREIHEVFKGKNIRFETRDYFEFLPEISKQDLVVIDPPYPNCQDYFDNPAHYLYYRTDKKLEFHQKLQNFCNICLEKKVDFILFYLILGLECPYTLSINNSLHGIHVGVHPPYGLYAENIYTSISFSNAITQSQTMILYNTNVEGRIHSIIQDLQISPFEKYTCIAKLVQTDIALKLGQGSNMIIDERELMKALINRANEILTAWNCDGFKLTSERLEKSSSDRRLGEVWRQLETAWDNVSSQYVSSHEDKNKKIQELCEWYFQQKPIKDEPELFVHIFDRMVEEHGNNIAIIYNDENLSYVELNNKVNDLAQGLKQLKHKKDWPNGTPIGLFFENSPKAVISILATMKAGLAYVPLTVDSKLKDYRLTEFAKESELKFILAQDELIHRDFVSHVKHHIPDIEIQTFTQVVESPEQGKFINISISPDQDAYIIFSSGSTGKPKGTRIPQKNLRYPLEAVGKIFDIKPNDHIGWHSLLTFDASILDIMTALGHGATLVIIPQEIRTELAALSTYLSIHQVTIITLVPAILRALNPENLPQLRGFISTGESSDRDMFEKWYRNGREGNIPRICINGIGQTEATICTSLGKYKPEFPLNIGKEAIKGLNWHIFQCASAQDPYPTSPQIVQSRECGELYLSGECLGRYLKKDTDALYHRRFRYILLPDRQVERIFQTGDIVKENEWGYLEFQSRVDGLCKFFGEMVNLDEMAKTISDYLSHHYQIKFDNVEVVLKEPNDLEGYSQRYLTAYIGVDEGKHPDVNQLCHYLKHHSSSNFIPSRIMIVPNNLWPRNANQKTDRQALSLLPINPIYPGCLIRDIPEGDVEKNLARLWYTHLNVKEEHYSIALDDDFCLLGGSSIHAMHLLNDIRKQYPSCRLTVSEFLRYPTLRRLAAHIILSIDSKKSEPNVNPVSWITGENAFLEDKSKCTVPVVIVHSIFGEPVDDYAQLIPHFLENHPLLEMRSLALIDPGYYASSLEKLASHYLTYLEKVAGFKRYRGPIYFLGYSAAGTLAYELTRQCQERRQDAAVCSIDTPSVEHYKQLSQRDYARELYAVLNHVIRTQLDIDKDICDENTLAEYPKRAQLTVFWHQFLNVLSKWSEPTRSEKYKKGLGLYMTFFNLVQNYFDYTLQPLNCWNSASLLAFDGSQKEKGDLRLCWPNSILINVKTIAMAQHLNFVHDGKFVSQQIMPCLSEWRSIRKSSLFEVQFAEQQEIASQAGEYVDNVESFFSSLYDFISDIKTLIQKLKNFLSHRDLNKTMESWEEYARACLFYRNKIKQFVEDIKTALIEIALDSVKVKFKIDKICYSARQFEVCFDSEIDLTEIEAYTRGQLNLFQKLMYTLQVQIDVLLQIKKQYSNSERALELVNQLEQPAMISTSFSTANRYYVRSMNNNYYLLSGVSIGVHFLIKRRKILFLDDYIVNQRHKLTEAHQAAIEGDLTKFMTILKDKPNLAIVKAGGGFIPLHHAVINHRLDVVIYLLNAGINPDERTGEDDQRSTSLELIFRRLNRSALSRSDEYERTVLDMLRALIFFGAKTDASLYQLAGEARYLIDNAVQSLEEMWSKLVAISESSQLSVNDETILNECKKYRYFSWKKDDNGMSLIHLAARGNNQQLVRQLVAHNGQLIYKKSANANQTPLHYSAEECHIDTIKILLDQKALVNAQDINGNTPLHLMLTRFTQSDKRPRRQSALIHAIQIFYYHPDINLRIRNNESKSVFDLLVKVYPEIQAIENSSAELLNSSDEPNLEISCEDLRKTKINPYKRESTFDCMAIHKAAWRGNASLLAVLVEYNPNLLLMPAGGGLFPLHHACKNGQEAAIRFFLQHVKRTNCNNMFFELGDHGFLPIDYTVQRGDDRVFKLLYLTYYPKLKQKNILHFYLEKWMQSAVNQKHCRLVAKLILVGGFCYYNMEYFVNNFLVKEFPEKLLQKLFRSIVYAYHKEKITIDEMKKFRQLININEFLKSTFNEVGKEIRKSTVTLHEDLKANLASLGKYKKSGASFYKKQKNKYKSTPIHLAAYKGDLGAVKYLVGIDPTVLLDKSGGGWLPIHQAAANHQLEVLKFILEKDPTQVNLRVDRENDNHATPLLLALERYALRTPHRSDMTQQILQEVVNLLIDYGGEVNLRNRDGQTAAELITCYRLPVELPQSNEEGAIPDLN